MFRASMETKTCVSCECAKTIQEFGIVKWGDKSYSLNQCRECYYAKDVQNINSNPTKYFQVLLNASKKRAINRAKNEQGSAGDFTIDLEDIENLHENQKGTCYYSGIPYVLKIKSHFQCSLERLDPKKGYTPDNIALVILELNNASQWTIQKFTTFLNLIRQENTENVVDFTHVRKRPIPHKKKSTIIEVNLIHCQHCVYCSNLKPLTDFRAGHRCETCCKEIYKQKKNIPMFQMNLILRHAKHRHTKKFNTTPFDLDFTFMVDLFNAQGGLCHYSGIPMTFGSYLEKHWTCSLERLDSSIGYTRDNVCFIIYELNTSDRPMDNGEKSGWSKSKFDIFKSQVIS